MSDELHIPGLSEAIASIGDVPEAPTIPISDSSETTEEPEIEVAPKEEKKSGGITIPDIPLFSTAKRRAAGTVSPREVGVDTDSLPVRRGRPRKVDPNKPVPPSQQEIANLLTMAHIVGSTVMGPEFMITKEQSDAIAKAAVPVIEDFGVAVAGKALHLLTLGAAIITIEGPILMKTVESMQRRANSQRDAHMVVGGVPMQETAPPTPIRPDFADTISAMTGVAVGSASGA